MATINFTNGTSRELPLQAVAVGFVATSVEITGKDAKWMCDVANRDPATFRAWLNQFMARFAENRAPNLLDPPEPALKYEALSARQRQILDALFGLDVERAVTFRWISEHSGIWNDSTTRLVTRKLAKMGLTEHVRGLTTEEGELAGSGYRITKLGRQVVNAAGLN